MEHNEVPSPAANDASLDDRAQPETENSAEGIAGFVREHPGLVIAGGLAIGLIAGALVPKRNRQRLAKGASQLAEFATTTGLALARQAQERATTSGQELRRQGASVAEVLERLAGTAGGRIHELADGANHVATRAGEQIARATSDIRSRVKR